MEVKTKIRYLSLGRRLQGGGRRLVPPGQRGAEPLHLAQVDEEGAIRTVHTVKSVARVGVPTSTHPLEDREPTDVILSPCHWQDQTCEELYI